MGSLLLTLAHTLDRFQNLKAFQRPLLTPISSFIDLYQPPVLIFIPFAPC